MEQPAPRHKRRRQLGGRRALAQGFGKGRKQTQAAGQVKRNPPHKKVEKHFYCKVCQKSYLGPCAHHIRLCFFCQSSNHLAADCPRKMDQLLDSSDSEESSRSHQLLVGEMFCQAQVDPECGTTTLEDTRQLRDLASQYLKRNAISKQKRFYCKACRKSYLNPCTYHSSGCRICGSPDHWRIDCPDKQDRTCSNSHSGGSNQSSQLFIEGMLGPAQADLRRDEGHGHQQYGGQFRQDTTPVHVIFGQEYLTTEDREQSAQKMDDGGSRRVALPASRLPVAPPARRPGMVDASRRRRYFCMQCQRVHVGPCARRNGTCFRCQSSDHWKVDCPIIRNKRNTDLGGRNQASQPNEETKCDPAREYATGGQKNQKIENRDRLIRQLDPSG